MGAAACPAIMPEARVGTRDGKDKGGGPSRAQPPKIGIKQAKLMQLNHCREIEIITAAPKLIRSRKAQDTPHAALLNCHGPRLNVNNSAAIRQHFSNPTIFRSDARFTQNDRHRIAPPNHDTTQTPGSYRQRLGGWC
jgi:hypothetical protein